MKPARGFTLIELLVVISIISLLSSVVLASLNAAREKGRLASLRQFSSQVDRAAGDQAVSIWDFDECSGTTARDRAGIAGTGQFVGAPSWSTDVPGTVGCAISLDGSSYVVASSSDLGITSQMALSFWMKPTTLSAYTGLVSKHQAGPGGSWKLGATDTANGLRFDVFNASTYTSATAGFAPDGKWHHVVGVYDGSTAFLYIDGVMRSSQAFAGGVRSSAADIQIGNDGCCGGRMYTGLIDGVRVFSKTLTAYDVGRLYAAEAHRYAAADVQY